MGVHEVRERGKGCSASSNCSEGLLEGGLEMRNLGFCTRVQTETGLGLGKKEEKRGENLPHVDQLEETEVLVRPQRTGISGGEGKNAGKNVCKEKGKIVFP